VHLPHDSVLVSAAETYGTPLFLYDLDDVRAQHATLARDLPDVDVRYAVKANSSLAVCAALAGAGLGAEICSDGELVLALAAGFRAETIVLGGPAKTEATYAAAMAAGVGLVVVESVEDARRLDSAARGAGRTQPVLLRINPAEPPPRVGVPLSGGASKFGVDEEEAEDALCRVGALPNLRLEGIHVYLESSICDAEILVRLHAQTIELADRLRSAGFAFGVVNLGSGLGVPYTEGEAPLDLPRYAARMRGVRAAAAYPYRIVMEVGRFLVASSGTYLTRVLDVKRSRGHTFALVDGGIHNLYRRAMARANNLARVVGKRGPYAPVSIGGVLPAPDDVLTEGVELASPEPGDLIAIPQCGAYTFTHSISRFALHCSAAEAVLEGGRTALARERGDPSDGLARQILPSARMAVPLVASAVG
jgi:diaminopimelate decarboxylase